MLYELSFVQYDDLLCRNDGRETVCNDDNRLILDQMLQSLLHLIFISGSAKQSLRPAPG